MGEEHVESPCVETGKRISSRATWPMARPVLQQQQGCNSHWEMRTVPLRGEHGEAFSLRPSGVTYESPTSNVLKSAPKEAPFRSINSEAGAICSTANVYQPQQHMAPIVDGKGKEV